MESDIALLESWWKGRDAQAFNDIVSRYAGLVYATCLRVLGDPGDAEDVTQDCFLRLAERPAELHTSLGGWLHRMAIHRSLNARQARSRRRLRETRYTEERAGDPASPGDALLWRDMRERVDQAIDALPEEQRTVIVAHFLERRTHQAIADELGLTRRAILYRIEKGVERIRQSLAKQGVTATGSVLSALLASRMVEAAPIGLASELGRLALAGRTGTAIGVGGLLGGIGVMKTSVLGVGVLAAGLLAIWSLTDHPATPVDFGPLAVPVQETRDSTADLRPSPEAPVATQAAQVEMDASEPPVTVPERRAAVRDVPEGAVVEGLVRNIRGMPIPGAAIHIPQRPTQDGALNKPPMTHTAADGTFRVEGVNPKVQTVFADHPDYAPGWVGMKPSLDTAEQVEILLTTGGAIEGTVHIGDEPWPHANVSVWLDASGKSVRTDEDGHYHLARVSPGTWRVGLILKDAHGIQREATQIVEVEAGMSTELNFELPAPDAALAGTVTVLGEAVSRGYLRLSITTPQGFIEERTESIGGGGDYVFRGLFEGVAEVVAVAVVAGRKEYRKAASCQLPAGEVTTLDIDIVPGTGILSGTVVLAEPAGNGGIFLLEGEVALPRLTPEAMADIGSRLVGRSEDLGQPYVFRELSPGTYTLLILVHPEEAELTNTVDPLANALFDIQVVAVANGEETLVDLHPQPVQ